MVDKFIGWFKPKTTENYNDYDPIAYGGDRVTKFTKYVIDHHKDSNICETVQNMINNGANPTLGTKNNARSTTLVTLLVSTDFGKFDINTAQLNLIILLTSKYNIYNYEYTLRASIVVDKCFRIIKYMYDKIDYDLNKETLNTYLNYMLLHKKYSDAFILLFLNPQSILLNDNYFEIIKRNSDRLLHHVETFNLDITGLRNKEDKHISSYAIENKISMDYINYYVNDITISNDLYCELLLSCLKSDNYDVFIKLIINDCLNLDGGYEAFVYLNNMNDELYYKYTSALFEYGKPTSYIKKIIKSHGRPLIIQKYFNGTQIIKLEKPVTITKAIENKLLNQDKFPSEIKTNMDNIKPNYGDNLDDDINLCCICLVNTRNTVFVGCGHICCCFDCINGLCNNNINTPLDCPICRTNSNVIKIYQ